MDVFIFGTGAYYRAYRKWTKQFNIIGFLDNDPLLQGTELDGHKVISPEELDHYSFDRIYILSTFLNEIRAQLLSLGVPEQKIYYFFQLKQADAEPYVRFYHPQNHGPEDSGSPKKMVMISHDLSITGAPKCLLQAAEILIRNGYDVTVASPYDGDLKTDFLKAGAKVIVDEHLRIGTLNDIDWLDKYHIVFVNTVQLYYLLLDRPLQVPTVWWIHEPEVLYKSVVPHLIRRIKKEKLKVYAVGEIAERTLEKYWQDININDLIYGIPDGRGQERKNEKQSKSKMRFITVGSISKLKGHDVLVQAISLLTEKEKKQTEFWLVGKADTKLRIEIEKKIEDLRLPVVIKGEMENQRLLELLEEMDVLICASRIETMSMAVTEGMMKGITVIMPDTAGIVRYINDGKNGFVFQSENAESLREKISFCINDQEDLGEIAEAGRTTYLKNFSLEAFEKRLIKLISAI